LQAHGSRDGPGAVFRGLSSRVNIPPKILDQPEQIVSIGGRRNKPEVFVESSGVIVLRMDCKRPNTGKPQPLPSHNTFCETDPNCRRHLSLNRAHQIKSEWTILKSSFAARCARLLGSRLTSVAGSGPYKVWVESRLDKAKVVPALGDNHPLTLRLLKPRL
jgi:hypothetical protein